MGIQATDGLNLDKLTITAVQPNMVPFVWDKVEPLLQLVVNKAPDDLSTDGLKIRIVSGNTILVIIHNKDDIVAVNTLEVEHYMTGKKVLLIPITGGTRLNEWMDDFLLFAQSVAKQYDCEALRGFSVRPGWLRTLNKNKEDNDMWNEVHTVIEYKIKETI